MTVLMRYGMMNPGRVSQFHRRQQWSINVNYSGLSWNRKFNHATRCEIIDFDENGNEYALAATDVDVQLQYLL